MRTIVIGGGHAGVQVADSLRAQGYRDEIVLVDEDGSPPYNKPPLSKDFLRHDDAGTPVLLRGAEFFGSIGVTTRFGTHVNNIDREARRVTFDDRTELSYDALVLATGGINRTLNVPGADKDGICGLRTLSDARTLRARLDANPTSVVVIGGGFIGLEFAAAARIRGLDVTVIEAAPGLMTRVLSAGMSEYFAQLHQSHGVRMVFDDSVHRFGGGTAVTYVDTASGRHPAELVVVGVGVTPCTGLAEAAGLDVDNGVVVDEYLKTSDDHIFAIGDCAKFPCLYAGTHIRLESIQNAVDQAKCVAKTIAGHPTSYQELPWFWSKQYDVKLQIAGVCNGEPPDRDVIEGDIAANKFSIVRYQGDRVVAVESVNQPARHVAARRSIAATVPRTTCQAS